MTNEVSATVFGGNVGMTDSKALLDAMENTSADDPRAGDKQFLNFSGKRGLYSAGADRTSMGTDHRLAVNVASFMNGWICWKGGKPVAKIFAPASQTTPARPSDDEHGPFERSEDGWMQAKKFNLKDIDTGVEYEFSTNSASGCNAVANLANEVRDRIVEEQDCWPVISLDAEEFTAQGYKNFKPVFKAEAWKSFEALSALLNDEEGDAPTEVQEEEDEPVQEEAPRRRRRSL